MSNALSGRTQRSAKATNASSPPNITFQNREPNEWDRDNVQVGDLWLFTDPTPGTNYQELYYLASLKGDGVTAGEKAKWILLASGTTGNVSSFLTDTGIVAPDLNGQVQYPAGENTNTQVGATSSEMKLNLNRTIQWPTSNANQGVIFLDGKRFLHNSGQTDSDTNNTFLGINSGRFAISGINNTGIGSLALNSASSAFNNTAAGASALKDHEELGDNSAYGYSSLGSSVDCENCTAIGSGSLENALHSVNCIAVGYLAGSNYTGSESNNIVIGNEGVLGDNDAIRIGKAGFQTSAYIQGIQNVTVAAPLNDGYVLNINDAGQIGEVKLLSSDGSIVIDALSVPGEIDFTTTGGGGGSGTPVSFSYYQANDETIAMGVRYALGSAQALTQIWDESVATVYPGDGLGAGAYFTAPVAGKYYIEWAAGLQGDPSTITMELETSVGPNYIATYSGGIGVHSAVLDLALNETVYFYITEVTAPNLNLSGNNISPTVTFNATRISGFLLIGTDNPINVLQADAGSASGPTVAIQGGYNITTAAAANVLEINVSGTTDHAVQVGNATNSLTSLALGNANQVLTSNGAAADPSFEDSSAFFAYLPSSVTVATGSPAYDLGSTVALVEDFDIGTNFDPGNGAGIGCFFTAPRDGVYEFTLSAFVTTAFPNNFPNFIITRPGRVYQGRGSTFVSNQFTIQTELSSTDVVTFSIEHVGLPFSPYDIEGNGGGSVEYATFVSGKRIG